MNNDALKTCPVGTRIFFRTEKRPYRVRARSERYLVCTKPFNPQRTVLYTIVDLVENVRGPENLIFCHGAETDAQCSEMIQRLEGQDKICGPTEVSHRNRIPLDIASVVVP